MKLKVFNPETAPVSSARTTRPIIHMNGKSGTIVFNKLAVEKLKLKAGNQVQFHQDEETPTDWYLEKVKSGGFDLRDKKGSGLLFFNSVATVRALFASVEFAKSSGRILIGGDIDFEKRTLTTLITANLTNG